MSNQPKVFISYSSVDQGRALEVDALLRAYRVKTFMDFDREIENELPLENVWRELEACQVVVLIWSQEAADDEVVTADWRTALSFNKPVVPYIFDNAVLPPELNANLTVMVGDVQDAKDEILRSIYGANPVPMPHEPLAIAMASGHWRVEIDERQYVSVMEMDLSPDGKIHGEHEKLGLSGFLDGDWQYHSADNLLSLEIESRFGLRPNNYVLRIHLTSQDEEAIYGEDLYGFAGINKYKFIKGS